MSLLRISTPKTSCEIFQTPELKLVSIEMKHTVDLKRFDHDLHTGGGFHPFGGLIFTIPYC
jgi:hypothetical protein